MSRCAIGVLLQFSTRPRLSELYLCNESSDMPLPIGGIPPGSSAANPGVKQMHVRQTTWTIRVAALAVAAMSCSTALGETKNDIEPQLSRLFYDEAPTR